MPAYEDLAYRVEFFGDEVERITEIDPLTGEMLWQPARTIDIFPAKHFITPQDKLDRGDRSIIEKELEEQLASSSAQQDKLLEAQRIEQRTRYDLEMLREVGYCSGIENYSPAPALAARPASRPWTLLDYFPDDYLLVVDESAHDVPADARHVQRRPGAQGDAGRLRLPAALARWTTGR